MAKILYNLKITSLFISSVSLLTGEVWNRLLENWTVDSSMKNMYKEHECTRDNDWLKWGSNTHTHAHIQEKKNQPQEIFQIDLYKYWILYKYTVPLSLENKISSWPENIQNCLWPYETSKRPLEADRHVTTAEKRQCKQPSKY